MSECNCPSLAYLAYFYCSECDITYTKLRCPTCGQVWGRAQMVCSGRMARAELRWCERKGRH